MGMPYEHAEFWSNTINALLGGHRVIFVDARQWQDWKPDVKVETLTKANVFRYDHASTEGSFNIGSSYGVHSALDTFSIDADNREIIMYSKNAAAGEPCWRIIRDLDASDNWRAWRDAQEASWLALGA